MVKAKKAKSLSSSSEASEGAEGEPPDEILLQKTIFPVLNDTSDRARTPTVLEKLVEENRDLIVWVSPNPGEVAPFDPSISNIGEYSPYNAGLYQGSERKYSIW